MTRNMSTLDRSIRPVAAAGAVVAAVVLGPGSVGGILLLVLAAVFGVTSAVGFCPLYTVLRLDTRGRKPLPH